MRIQKKCAICGTFFIAQRSNAKYCSELCALNGREEVRKKRERAAAERKKEETKKKKVKRETIAEVAVAARAAGLTYGQYVAKRMMEQT